MLRIFVFAILFLGLGASAQEPPRSITLRILDGRNASPVAGELVNLWYDEQSGNPIVVRTDESGAVILPPPLSHAVRLFLAPLASIDCRKRAFPPVAYSLAEIGSTGITTQSTCGSPSIKRGAGEIVLFVRNRRWYDNVNR